MSKKIKIKILILCGGRGKRMGKYTVKIPKPLIKVGKIPIIQHKINYYKKQGFKNLTFCVGYKANIMKKFLKRNFQKPNFSFSGVDSGILKRIHFALKNHNETTIISYGDTLAKINLMDLIKKHNKSNSLMSLVIAPIRNPFGIVKWNLKNKITSFEEKPVLNHFIGYAVLEPKIFKILNKNIINSRDGIGLIKAIKLLVSKRLVNVYKYDGLQLTVNSISELKEARSKIGKYITFS
ncbi:MAG: hypothetical protein CMI79_03245 [Candidatus Pelagibacter sp.]|nr:hypothetical protein [Candidatus Pelagibacter sp.]|tara:strand:- start:317 stop:1027 length:711 start_codon:yes stop_codon:yes gene_type:complete